MHDQIKINPNSMSPVTIDVAMRQMSVVIITNRMLLTTWSTNGQPLVSVRRDRKDAIYYDGE